MVYKGVEVKKPVEVEDARVVVTRTVLDLEIVDEDGRDNENEGGTSANSCPGDGT